MIAPMNTVSFNGVNLSTFYGVYVSGNQTFSSAEHDYEEITVPGRSGSLFIDNKTYKNTKHSYDAWIGENLETNLRGLRSFLASSSGYCRLEDTYHTDEFYKAIFKGPLDVETILLTAGVFTLEFERMPQRFLNSGSQVTSFTASGSITNPTLFNSKPLVRVYGTGNLTVNGTAITILSHTYSYIDIDSETMDCYCTSANCNNYVQLSGNKYPELKAGANSIVLGSGITKVEITPRWYNL